MRDFLLPPLRRAPAHPSRINGRPHTPTLVVLAALIAALAAFLPPPVRGYDAELCVVQTPLKSPYFVPYVIVSSPCLGCVFSNPSSPSTTVRIHGNEVISVTSVHVLEVRNPQIGSVEITLQLNYSNSSYFVNESGVDEINEEKWIAIVLATETPDAPPISFVLSRSLAPLNFSVLLLTRSKDQVEASKDVLEPSMEGKNSARGRVVIEVLNGTSGGPVEEAKHLFGFVTSLTKTLDANRVALKVFFAEDEPKFPNDDCGEGITQPSPVAECSGAVPKQTSGCYHENLIGTSEKEVHIIEVEMPLLSNTTGAINTQSAISLLVKGIDTPSPSSSSSSMRVEASGATGKGTPDGTVARNLTLVLRSNRPTTWTLRVSRLQGSVTLLVGRGDQVENKSSSSYAGGARPPTVSVRRQEMPESFDRMILHVLTTIGPPVSYTKTRAPDLIVLGVPPPAEPALPHNTVSVEKESIPEIFEPQTANSLITSYVTQECGGGRVRVALPLWVAERLGGVAMTLRDSACRETKNGTHVVLIARYSDCGFQHEVSGGAHIYTNFAHIQVGRSLVPMTVGITDDEDFEGSGYGMEDPFRRRIPTVVVRCKKDINGEMNSFPPSEDGMLPPFDYSLEVYRDRRYSLPYHHFPVMLLEDDVVHARLSFSSGLSPLPPALDLRLLIEKCWLSPSAGGGEGPLSLISKSCPIDASVHIRRDLVRHDVRFAFQLSVRYVQNENLYLHCQVGVCSQAALPKLTFKKCVDPDGYCRKLSLVDVFANQALASHLATLITGPFVLHTPKEGLSHLNLGAAETMTARLDDFEADATNPKEDPKDGKPVSPVVVLEGLSTEAVVGIAVASFGIGVCLTATLWLIYAKTDPRRQKRPSESQVPRSSGYDLSAHSGSSTPSSQAPMTA